jgi:malignant T-cell-amplified sequence
MFKKWVSNSPVSILKGRFNPKEDVSGSTSIKSSTQRQIRAALLQQFPLLSSPAYRPDAPASSSAPHKQQSELPIESTVTPEAAEAGEVGEAVEEEDDEPKKGKKKGGGGGGKTKKSNKKDKGKEKDDVPEDEEGEVLVIDEIWPKKESLGLTKWYVMCDGLTE